MVATVIINEKNGAGETATDKTSGTVRFKNADDATVDTNDPLVSGAVTDWSFEKWLRLNAAGTFTQLTNLKFYTDGANGLGANISLWAKAVASFVTPAEGSSSAGYADAFSYDSGSPLSLGAGPYTSTGDVGNYLVMLMDVATGASQGGTPTETITFAWDEI